MKRFGIGRWIAIEFRPRNLWIGAHWTTKRIDLGRGQSYVEWQLWVCLVPCFPIHVMIAKTNKPKEVGK